MSFKEIDTEESTSSLSEVSSLDDDLDSMRLEFGSSVEETSDDEMDSNSWNEIKSESDAEFMEEDGLDEDATSKTFCSDCNIYFCLDCFNEKHQFYVTNDSENSEGKADRTFVYPSA